MITDRHDLLDIRDGIAVVWIDNPPVNALSRAVRLRLAHALAQAAGAPEVTGVVIASRGSIFSAGADVRELASPPPSEPPPPDVMAAMDALPKPIVSALQGKALGGGLELALASDWRIAAPDATLGLPEVRLGILPGWGGTQRLPRLVGPKTALDLMLAGRSVDAGEALELGLVDRIADGDLLTRALAFAQEVAPRGRRASHPVVAWPDDASIAEIMEAARARIAREMSSQHAPLRIIECVQASLRLPLARGLAFEREQFRLATQDPQARAMQHAFLAERKAAAAGRGSSPAQPRKIGTAAVVGAGTMGRGIAMAFANAGIPVLLLDRDQELVDQALAAVRATYDASVRRGRIGAARREDCLGRIRTSASLTDADSADIIVEAAFERMAVKQALFADIDKVARPGAVLATNTSFLSIDAIASATSRPGDVVGMHFFAPANVMKLLEVVRGEAATSEETLATVLDLARRLGKLPVVARDRYGFIGNRMINAYLHQADLLLLEGAGPAQVDAALVAFGMAMGPFQMRDLSGFSGVAKSRRERGLHLYDPRSIPVLERLLALDRQGQKTRAGYYDYSPEHRGAAPSAVVTRVIEETAHELGIGRRTIGDDEIVERCLLALANEGMDVLAEGTAASPGDIDVVYLNGYGFPRHQGGPMHWFEQSIGLPRALERLKFWSEHVGVRWLRPSPEIASRVAAGRGLSEA